MKSLIIGFLVTVVMATVFVTYNGSEKKKMEEIGGVPNKELAEIKSNERRTVQQHQVTTPDKIAASQEWTETASEHAHSASKEQQEFATKSIHFASEDELNNSFVTNNDTVLQSAIINTMKSENFSQFLKGMADMERSNHALTREIKLQQFLQQSKLPIYQESYACSGRICGVMLTAADNSNDADLKQLHLFETNYSFYNITKDDAGNKVLKAVFIETEDPANLTLAH